MRCNSCGSDVNKDDQFCSRCGYWLDVEENTRNKLESLKTLLFLITTFVILFVIIYRIHSNFNSFMSHKLPMELSTDVATKKILGSWISNDKKGIVKSIKFEDTKFELQYNQSGKSISGIYTVEDSNTLTLYITTVNKDSIPENIDMIHKFHFDDNDTLVVIFNGITNVFKRKI